MKLKLGFIFLSSALLVASAPSSAQEASTPQQNLDCAAWAVLLRGTVEDPEQKAGAAAMVAWFIGLYEAAVGTSINDALIDRLAQFKDGDWEKWNAACSARAADFADRLSELGERIAALED